MSSHHTHCIESLHLDFNLPQRRAQLHTSDRRSAGHSELELCRQGPLALEVAPDKTRFRIWVLRSRGSETAWSRQAAIVEYTDDLFFDGIKNRVYILGEGFIEVW